MCSLSGGLVRGGGAASLLTDLGQREVCVDDQGRITRYNLAYINHNLHAGDNGRVVGYDNAHGFHHRHYFGVVEAIDFISYGDVEERFELDWTALKGRK